MLRLDEEHTLPNIGVPTLVMVGKNDRLTRLEASEFIASSIPDASLAVLEPAGHQAPLEQHSAFMQKVEQFVAQCNLVHYVQTSASEE